MSDKKPRWFQIHLSTAIVLMFVAGGLLAANISPSLEHRIFKQSVSTDGDGAGWGALGARNTMRSFRAGL